MQAFLFALGLVDMLVSPAVLLLYVVRQGKATGLTAACHATVTFYSPEILVNFSHGDQQT